MSILADRIRWTVTRGMRIGQLDNLNYACSRLLCMSIACGSVYSTLSCAAGMTVLSFLYQDELKRCMESKS